MYDKFFNQLLFILLLFVFTSTQAVETAPRISDKEIIEGLANLNNEIAQSEARLNAKIAQSEASLNAKIIRLEIGQQTLNQRFDDLRANINERFSIMESRFSELWSLMIAILVSIFGLIGFVVWDRKTATKPLEQKLIKVEQNLAKIEQDLERDLELNSKEGSKLTRMIHAFRELAKEDQKVAAVLRSFQLL